MNIFREHTNQERQIEAAPNQIYVDDIRTPKLALSLRINSSQTVLVILAPKQDKAATVLLNDDAAGIALAGLVRQEIETPSKLIILRGNQAKPAMTKLILQTLQTGLCLWGDNVLDVDMKLPEGESQIVGVRGDVAYVRLPGQPLIEVSFKALARQANES